MKGTIQEFVFEIVVDKKLVPKEVLETGDQNYIPTLLALPL